MALKIVGVRRSAGSFDDPKTGKSIEYDNIKIYCVRPMAASSKDDNWFFGKEIIEIKVKNDVVDIADIFGFDLCKQDFEKLIGHDINCFYDENKKPVMITFPNVDIVQVLHPVAKAKA